MYLKLNQDNNTRMVITILLIVILSAFTRIEEKPQMIKKVYIQAETQLLKPKNDFSKEKLVQLIKDLHIQYPEIVYSQFTFESGHFKSPMFKRQNNIMGMQYATSRPTTAIGEEGGYAVFRDWRDCVIDYALYQSAFLRGATREEYYHYLQQVYAKNPNYTKELKAHIINNNIKQLFK